MRILKIISNIMCLPVGIPHEICHYVVARLLGFRARFTLSYVAVKGIKEDDWRFAVIWLAPALVGALALAWVSWLSYTTGDRLLLAYGLAFSIPWYCSCWDDFCDVLRVEWNGKWNWSG